MLLNVTPDALVTAPFSLVVDGLLAHAEVTIRAETVDRHGERWHAWATFRAGPTGQVDVARQAPLAGSYAGTDARGLLWSLRPRPELSPAFFETPDPGYAVTFRAEQDGRLLAEAGTFRQARAPCLREQEVRQDGLYGTLFSPPDGQPVRGAVLMLGGSEGGLYDTGAALLASEGFLVFNLAYFGLPGLPASLINIPLEYFQRATAYLRAQPGVQGRRIGVTGASKGAEAALLLGATYPDEIGAVVAVAPSGLIFEGIDREGTYPKGVPMSSWSLAGRPLPYLPYNADWNALFSGSSPVEMMAIHRRAVAAAASETVEAATIAAERIRGPVLLVSGGQDQVWHATELAQIAQRRRQVAGLSVEHLSHPRAGHSLSLPGFPTYIQTPWTAMGGDPEADAQLQFLSWPRKLEILAAVWAESAPL